jgi:FtsH-binding integral membrane protein
VIVGMLLAGGGAPLSFAAMAKLVVDAVRRSETGVASGLNTVMRTVGGVVGGQLAAAVIAGSVVAGTTAPKESGYTTAFWFAAAAAALGIVAALAVSPRPVPPPD